MAAVMMAVMLTAAGCGSSHGDSGSMKYAASEAMAPEAAGAANDYMDYDTSALYETDVAEETMEMNSENGTTQAETPKDNSRKLITTMHISAETDDMDALLNHVEAKVAALGGYIEASDVTNGSLRNYGDKTQRYRSASLTIRIPAQNLSDFVSDVQERTNITSQSKNIEDVTLSYADLESHKRMLKTEENRLLQFMEQAETVEDMLTVEERLTNVQYQIDSMESQLRTYDNKVNYSTIYLGIEEVVEYTVVEEKEKTVWEEISEGFGESLLSVGHGLRVFFVWLVTHIPQLVIWAIVIFLVVKVIGLIRRRHLKKLAEMSADGTGRPLTPREQRKLEKMAKKKARKNGSDFQAPGGNGQPMTPPGQPMTPPEQQN